MTVVLNEVALTALLDTEDGPVGRFVEDTAFRVVVAARQNIRDYYHGAPSLEVERDVDIDMEGSSGIIGIRDGGRKTRYLARRQNEGVINWLTLAVDTVRASGG